MDTSGNQNTKDKSHHFKTVTLYDIYQAAWIWYGKQDTDSCCLAENRLMSGEKVETNDDY